MVDFATFSFLPSAEEEAQERAKDALRFKPAAHPCVTCDHIRWSIFGSHKCVTPMQRADRVTGEKKQFCEINRQYEDLCGMNARWHSINQKNRVIWIQQHGDIDAKG